MRVLSPAFQAHLDTGTTTIATCWKVTLGNGTVLGFTDHDRPLVFDGVTFEPDSGLAGTEVKTTLGFGVSTQEVHGLLDSTRIKESDIRAGHWNNAEVVEYLVDWSDVATREVLRTANIGRIQHGAKGFAAELRGLAHDMGQAGGRFYNPTCDAEIGDARCGLNLSDSRYTATGTVNATDGGVHVWPQALVTGAGNDTEGLFTGGKITFTSGASSGLSFDIGQHIGSGADVHLVLVEPAPFDIAVGDTFAATVGCPKTAEACYRLFDNMVNFRGFNRMPGNDRAMLQVDPNDEYGNDGSSLFSQPNDTASPQTVNNPAPSNGGFFGQRLGGDQ